MEKKLRPYSLVTEAIILMKKVCKPIGENFSKKMYCEPRSEWLYNQNKYSCVVNITSSPKIVAYEPELKSLTDTSVVLALTVKSFSRDKTNLTRKVKSKRLKSKAQLN